MATRKRKKTAKPRAKAKRAPARGTKATAKAKRARERKLYGRRKDLGGSIQPFLAKLDDDKRAIVLRVRDIVRDTVPGVQEALKWGMPVWSKDGLLCYCAPAKSYIRFGFYKPVIDDSAGLPVEGANMPHVKLTSASQVVKEAFANWTRRAAALNARG